MKKQSTRMQKAYELHSSHPKIPFTNLPPKNQVQVSTIVCGSYMNSRVMDSPDNCKVAGDDNEAMWCLALTSLCLIEGNPLIGHDRVCAQQ